MKNKKVLFSILISLCLFFAVFLGVNSTPVFAETSVFESNQLNQSITIPEAYNSDYRNLSYITSVKNQENYGMCWAFSAVSCAETDALKNHGAQANINLSEWHLGYFLYHGERAGTGDVVSPGTVPYYNCGGNEMFAAFVVSNWIGFANESVAPYSTLVKNSKATIDASKMHQNEYIVNNVYTFNNTDKNSIKEAILTYGSAITSYCSSGAFLNTANYAQYCPYSENSDHSVTVVGWNDNYPKENFTNNYGTPSKNGAWLIKNSWGSDWGLNGYFWLSYQDASIDNFAAIDVVPVNTYDNLYSHDGGVSPIRYSENISPMANVFISNKDELLTHVGVTTYDPSIIKTSYNYTIKIYVNPISLDTSNSGFQFTNLAYTQTGQLEAAGYSNIELTTGVPLHKNDVFVVCVETESIIAVDANWAETSASGTITNSRAGVGKNQTYYYSKRTNMWYDAGDSSLTICDTLFNARIKAITNYGEAELKTAPNMSGIKYGQNLRSGTLTGGVVKNTLTGLDVSGVWSFVTPSIIPLDGDSVQVKFTPTDPYYSIITATIVAHVEATNVTMSATIPKTVYVPNEEVVITIKKSNPHNLDFTDLTNNVVTYQIEGGAENVVSGNKFIIPNTVSSGNEITIKIKSLALEGKYLERTITLTLTIAYRAEVGQEPVVSNISYGQTLSQATVSGVVVDYFSRTPINGTWVFLNPNKVPVNGEIVQVKFVPNVGNYADMEFDVAITVVATTINLQVTTPKETYSADDVVAVQIVKTNPNNASVTDFGNNVVTYKINNGEEQEVVNNRFTIPKTVNNNDVITIKVTSLAVNNKYTEKTASTTISVLYSSELLQNPVVGSINYGQPLSSSVISGGKVVDSSTRKSISGVWSFQFPTIIPTNTTSQLIKFVPANNNYNEIVVAVVVEVVPVSVTLNISFDKEEFIIGDVVNVIVTATNTNNQTLSDYGEITLYYLINGQNKTLINGTSFEITEQMIGKTLSVLAETSDVSGRYVKTEKTTNVKVFGGVYEEDPEIDEPTQEPDNNPPDEDVNDSVIPDNTPETEQPEEEQIKIDFTLAAIVVGCVFGIPVIGMIISLIFKRRRY